MTKLLIAVTKNQTRSGLAPVVQTLDSAIHRIDHYPAIIRETNCAIHWIDFYPVDSAIQRLNNRGLESRVSIHAVTVDYRVDVAVKVSKRARGGQNFASHSNSGDYRTT